MFGQVAEKLDSWLGRPFLLASFFPWLIFAVANALMAQFMAPSAAKVISAYFAGGFYGAVSGVAICLGAVAATAYVSDPLFLFMIRFLEGAYFPPCIAQWLSADQSQLLRDLEAAEYQAGEARAKIARAVDSIKAELSAARARGVKGGHIYERSLIALADDALTVLYDSKSQQLPISLEALIEAADALKRALEKNTSSIKRLYDGALRENVSDCNKLNTLCKLMDNILDYARDRSGIDHSKAVDRRQTRFATRELPSTRFGNETAAFSSFFETRFELDFDFFWPIFQILVQGDQKASDALVQSKQQLDFSIRIFWFTVAFTAIWLCWAGFYSPNVLVAPIIGTIGFVLSALWLEIVHTAYRAYAQVVRSIVILKRFDVIEALRMPVPKTWKEEKDVWTSAAYQFKWGAQVPISYEHAEK
jgi:hypothetical protein